MLRFVPSVSALACSGVLLVPASAPAQDEEGPVPFSRATVTKVVNEVTIVDAESLKKAPAEVDGTFEAPDLLATARRSRAELLAPDGTITRVGSNTIFSFEGESRTIELETGSLLFHSPSGKGGGVIRTSEASASVLGTTIAVCATSNGGFKLIVLEGTARLEYPSGSVQFLEAGQVTFVTPGDGVEAPVLNVNLEELVASSQLIQGFEEPLPSFDRIEEEAYAQARRIKGPSNLVLGDAPAGDTFQVIELPDDVRLVVSDDQREQQTDFDDGGSPVPATPGFNVAAANLALLDRGLNQAQADTVLGWNPTSAELSYALALSPDNLIYLTEVADEPIFESLFNAGIGNATIAGFAEAGLGNDELAALATLSPENYNAALEGPLPVDAAVLLAGAGLSDEDFATLLGQPLPILVQVLELQEDTAAPGRGNEQVILDELFAIGGGQINEQLIQAGILGNQLLTDTLVAGPVLNDNFIYNRAELVANDYNSAVIDLLGRVSGNTAITDSILAFLEAQDPAGGGATLETFEGANGDLLGTRSFSGAFDFFGTSPDDFVALIGNDIVIATGRVETAPFLAQNGGGSSGTVTGRVFSFSAIDDLLFDIPLDTSGEPMRKLVIDSGDPQAGTAVALGAAGEVLFRRDPDERSEPVVIEHRGSHLAIGSGADLNVLNVRMRSTDGSVSLGTLGNLIVAENSRLEPGEGENVYLYADQTLNADRVGFAPHTRDIVMNATTINLSNIDFPTAANVDLRSLNGPIDGKYPNFGSSVPGRVNFILNVSRGGNVMDDQPSFDAHSGGRIDIGNS